MQFNVLQQQGRDNLCFNLGKTSAFLFLIFYYGAAQLQDIIIDCNGCQSVRTGSECNFLNKGVNLPLRPLLLLLLWTFKSVALIETATVHHGAREPNRGLVM